MKKISTALATLAITLGLLSAVPSPAQAVAPTSTQPTVTAQVKTDVPVTARRRCKQVTNHYGGYDQFTVTAYHLGRYVGKNTFRTAIIASYKSCDRRVRGGKIGVEFRHISGESTSNKCAKITAFEANLIVRGFNPGPARTACNGQDSRFITWYPANPWVLKKGLRSEFKDISGTWKVDVNTQGDKSGSYTRLYPRFGA